MKRSDLAVGAELFYRRSPNYSPDKVKVLTVEPYMRRSGWGYRGDERFINTRNGTGVLVEYENGSKDVVPLATLKGPWAPLKAAYDIEQAENREAAKVATQARDAAQERAAALATTLGESWQVQAYIEGWERPRVVLDLDEAQKLLDLLDKLDPR